MKPRSAVLVAALIIGSPMAPAGAAEGLAGATVRPVSGALERPAHADAPERAGAGRRAQREQWCTENPDKCREVKARMAERRAQCEANPERCRQEMQARRAERIRRADTDGNGAISRAEAERSMPGLARHFDAVDANRDGQISPEEMDAARKARAANRKRQPG